ncbi:MAG: GntR family transcriptional regulator [Clostridia bacterium]|nr:GntR family transcriptional regulator [Clostridia bacterium]
MISFDQFIPNDHSPIYQQIILYIKQGIAAGTIRDGDEMPSRRVLSALLGVNPNTVQKSYKLLEEEGLISSTPGAKSCVVINDEITAAIRDDLLDSHARTAVAAMKQMGVSKDEALAALARLWAEI